MLLLHFVSSCSIRKFFHFKFDQKLIIKSETQGKTLEEIAELFGDNVAFTEYIGKHDTDQEPPMKAVTTDTEHVESQPKNI